MSSDYQSKGRSANYFNDLLVNDPQKLVKKYALSVADDIEDKRGNLLHSPVHEGITHEWRKVKGGQRIAYVKLTKKARGNAANTMYAGSNADVVSVIGMFNADNNAVPVYFLPWIKAGDGGVVHLKIKDFNAHPQVPNAQGNNIANPSVFFTASISGCSIFVQGNADSPIIYHAGGKTGHVDDPVQAAAHWDALITANYDNTRGAITTVDKTQYISEPNVVGGLTGQNHGSTTNAVNYQTFLTNHYQNRLEIFATQPWGSVLGFRDPITHNWSFYLQENATIFYYQYKKNIFGMRKNAVDRTAMYAVVRPMAVTRFYPGVGHAWIPVQQPKLKFG